MAFARPPRPQRKRRLVGRVGPNVQRGLGPLAPARSNVPKPPITATPPGSTRALAGGAPRTAAGDILRSSAETGLGSAQGAHRQGIIQAALRYGGADVLKGLMNDPQYDQFDPALQGAIDRPDPNSVFSTLGRERTQGLENVDAARNAGGTYFSGFRLQDRNRVNQDVDRQYGEAYSQYQAAINELNSALAEAMAQYGGQQFNASLGDIQTAQELEPEPTGPDRVPSEVTRPPRVISSARQPTTRGKRKPRKKGKR